jgi:ABC-type cobalamin transport system permease subunit
MKLHISTLSVLNVCSTISVAAAVFGALLLTGTEEQIVIRVSGVALVIFSIFSQRIPKSTSLGQASIGPGRAEKRELPATVQNIVSAVGIISALVMGYLIYFCQDSFPGRKIYLIIAAVVVLAAFTLSYMPSYFSRYSENK